MVREAELLSILVRFATSLTEDFSIQEVLDRVAEQIVELLPVTGAGVLLMDQGTDHHFLATTDERIRRIEGLQLELGEGPCLLAYDADAAVTLPDLRRDTTVPAFSRAAVAAGLGAVFSFPLRHGGCRLGVLELYASEPVTLDAAELAGAQTLADVVASYLLIARRRETAAAAAAQLVQAALHDPLTGLPNRRLLTDRLEQATRRSHRSGRPFGVIFCDVDEFKAVNDRFGHLAGDQVLAEVADRMSATLRPGDTLARVSGDEFVIVCEEVPGIAEVEEVAERASAALDAPFVVVGGVSDLELRVDLELGASFGVALAGAGHGSIEQALAGADAAMYRAKRRARERRHGAPLAGSPLTP